MHTVVIVGGGFGGIRTCMTLAKHTDVRVVLIDPNKEFVFTPLLHEAVGGHVRLESIHYPFSQICRKNVSYISSKVIGVDFEKKIVSYTEGRVSYDSLILATGAKTNYYDIPGAETYAYSLKTLRDAVRLKEAVAGFFERWNTGGTAVSQDQRRILIVGGGPTGIEIATEIRDLIDSLCRRASDGLSTAFEIVILQRGEDFLPLLPERLKRGVLDRLHQRGITMQFNSSVEEVDEKGVYVNGILLRGKLVIWSPGVKPAVLSSQEKSGYVVNPDLSIVGFSDAYAVGDVANHTNPDGKRTPMLAQAADRMGRRAAENILRKINGKEPRAFVFRKEGFIVSLGKGYAVAEVFGFLFAGYFAWLMYRMIYLVKTFGFRNKLRLVYDWIF